MPQMKADFAASAPSSAHNRAGSTFLPSKPASSHGAAPRAGRRTGQPQQKYRVPPLSAATAPVTAAAVRPSMISHEQRAALRVSAFGFHTHHGTSDQQQQPTDTTRKGRQTKVDRSRHTTCSDEAEVVVTMPEKDSARFHLCVQALAEGCVQTYTHLFGLSHRDPVCVDVLSQRYFVVPDDKLRWVQENLSSIEVLRRQSEFTEVMTRCQRLADYFEAENDLEEAGWHYDAALQYARESLDAGLELEALASYADFLERHGQLAAAVDMLESMRSLAVAVKDEKREREVCEALVRVYRALGDELVSKGELVAVDADVVKRCYEKSVYYAKRAQSTSREGEGYDAIGKILERGGQLGKALQYQQSYRTVSHENQLRSHECRAALNVAGLEGQLGRTADATASLHDALQLAKDLGDAEKVCRATMQLGNVYSAEGDTEAAMTCFKEAFAASFESGQQDLIDSVRVAMGFAAGAFYFANAGGGKGYLPIVCGDIRAQLAWMSNGQL